MSLPPDQPFDPGGQFPGLFGDLLRMMQTDAPLQWDLAVRFAQTVAADGRPEPNVDPGQRIRFEELARIAEMQVTDVTGMPVGGPDGRAEFVAVGPAEWGRRSLESWRPLIEGFASAVQPVELPGGDPGGPGEPDFALMMGQWAKAIGPAMIALQVGSAIGHLARRTLGQYELPLPRTAGHEIAIAPANVASFAEEWSLESDDVALWVAARDLAAHSLLSRRHVHDRFGELLIAHASLLRPDLGALSDRLTDLAGSIEQFADFTNLLGDAGGFDVDNSSPERARVRAELDALSAAIEGYVEWATEAVAERLIGARRPVAEAMRRRLIERTDEERAAERLFGLDLDQETIDRGEAFVTGVLERGGEKELGRLWVRRENLPTPAEVDAPGLWIARLNL